MHFKILVYESNGAKKLSRLVSLIKTSHEHLYVLQILQTNRYEIAFVKISVVTIEIFFERNSRKLTNKIRSFSFKIVANFDAFSTSFSRKFLLNLTKLKSKSLHFASRLYFCEKNKMEIFAKEIERKFGNPLS